jgi:hypothetical protein
LLSLRAKERKDLLQEAEKDLSSINQFFTDSSLDTIALLGGLIIVEKSKEVGELHVGTSVSLNYFHTFTLMFDKIEGDLINALKQIRDYIDSSDDKITISKALVFVSGTSLEQQEWATMWETLNGSYEERVWNRVTKLRETAQGLIRVPFDLVVAMDNPIKYDFFPWTRSA